MAVDTRNDAKDIGTTNLVLHGDERGTPGKYGPVALADLDPAVRALLSAASSAPGAVCGRLTLTTGLPVTTADVTGATSIYWTPFKGNQIQLWDGAAWTTYTFTETTLALGTKTSALPYDVFARQVAGVLTLDDLAWTNTTTRATAISIQDGRYCLSGDKTRLYLGTYYTSAATTTEDSLLKRYLWNYYNRALRSMKKTDSTGHTYTGVVRQWNNSTSNQVDFVTGVAEDIIVSVVNHESQATAGFPAVGQNIDTASSNDSYSYANNTGALITVCHVEGTSTYLPAAGKHFIAVTETNFSSGGLPTYSVFTLKVTSPG